MIVSNTSGSDNPKVEKTGMPLISSEVLGARTSERFCSLDSMNIYVRRSLRLAVRPTYRCFHVVDAGGRSFHVVWSWMVATREGLVIQNSQEAYMERPTAFWTLDLILDCDLC